MINQSEPNHVEAISKDEWYDWDAACILYNLDPKQFVEIDTFNNIFHIRIKEPQNLLDIIKTWKKPYSHASAPPYWYINEIIKKNLVEIPKALLQALTSSVMNLIEEDKKNIKEWYPYLSNKLNLSAPKPISISPEVDELKKIIDKTYDQFWKNYNPEKPPKGDEIVEWIMTTFEIADRNAQAIDTMIRPAKYRKGGNRSLR